jgi:hypothetical protein
MGFLNQRLRRGIVLTDQGAQFAQQFLQEGAGEVVIIICDFQERTGTVNHFFAVVCVQIVRLVVGMSEDWQPVDHNPQGFCRLARSG